MRGKRSSGRAGTLIALSASIIAAAPPPAHAYSSLALFEDPGSHTNAGYIENLDSSDSGFEISTKHDQLRVTVSAQRDETRRQDLVFSAPPGQELQEGRSYPDAVTTYYAPDPNRPVFEYLPCTIHHGSFEVMDLAKAADGTVTRFRAVFEDHCNEEPPAAYGEIKYDFPEPTGPQANPSELRFPARDLGSPPIPRPITVRAGNSAARFTGATITGSHAGAFGVTRDGCSNTTVAPHGTCSVWVRFDPAEAGQHSAALRVADTAGETTTTDLSGYAWGGTTDLTVKLNRHDTSFLSGKDLHMTAADGVFFADAPYFYPYEPQQYYGIAINRYNKQDPNITGEGAMTGRLWPPEGESLEVGRKYEVNSNNPQSEGGPGMDVGLPGQCQATSGWYRVNELRLGTDGQVRATDISFVENCKADKQLTLTGHFARRGGDTTPLACWMVAGAPAEWPGLDACAAPTSSATSSSDVQGSSASSVETASSGHHTGGAAPKAMTPRVALDSTSLRVSPLGDFSIDLSEPKGSPAVTVALQVTIRRPADKPAGAAATSQQVLAHTQVGVRNRKRIRLRLSRSGRRLLATARHGRLGVRIEGHVSGAGMRSHALHATAVLRRAAG